jgi:hypothetical protein
MGCCRIKTGSPVPDESFAAVFKFSQRWVRLGTMTFSAPVSLRQR